MGILIFYYLDIKAIQVMQLYGTAQIATIVAILVMKLAKLIFGSLNDYEKAYLV